MTFILGLLIQFLFSYIIWLFGKILQGKGDREEIRIVVAYSLLPQTVILIAIVVQLLANLSDPYHAGIGLFNNLTTLILSIVGLRIFAIGLSKVQKFSYGYALLNIFLPGLIIGFISLYFGYQ